MKRSSSLVRPRDNPWEGLHETRAVDAREKQENRHCNAGTGLSAGLEHCWTDASDPDRDTRFVTPWLLKWRSQNKTRRFKGHTPLDLA